MDHLFENPKVTVVMPSLNVASYIAECIESALHQTLKNIEILCVDAGSTDGTLEILQAYSAKDSRVKIVHSDRKSYGYQMNLGLSLAKGEYFAILETDDYIRPAMYEDLCAVADEHHLEVLKADYAIFKGDGRQREFTYKKILPVQSLYGKVLDPQSEPRVFRNYVVSWSGIYRTDFLKQHQIYHHESPGASFQDNGFWFQVFTQAHRVMFWDKVYYMLRRDNPNSSVFNPQKADCMFREYDYIYDYLIQHDDVKSQYSALYAFKRFKNLLWANDNLVGDDFRQDFIMKMSDDFRHLFDQDLIDPKLYSVHEYKTLLEIADNPKKFCQKYPHLQYAEGTAEKPTTSEPDIQQLIQDHKRRSHQVEHLKFLMERMNQQMSKQKKEHNNWLRRLAKRFRSKLSKVKKVILNLENQGFSYTCHWIFRKTVRKWIHSR